MDEESKKYINIFYFIVFIVLLVSLFFYKNSFLEKNKKEINNIKIKDRIYKVEIRNTDEGRKQGLSNTKHNYLCDDCALLFAWDNEGERTMWMKDMNYPIDIYWLDKNKQIVHAEYNVATSTYNKNNPRSLKIFGRGIYNAQYVLETLTH